MYRLLLGFLLLFCSFWSQAQTYTPTWQTRYGIEITENAGIAWSNQPVLLKLDLATLVADGVLLPDAADLRFAEDCEGAQPLNYFIEDATLTDTTQIWVEMPSLGIDEQKFIYLFANNPTATSASSFDAVFPPATRLLVASGETFTPVADNSYSWIEVEAGGTIQLDPTDANLNPTPFIPVFTASKIILDGDVVLDGAGFLGGDINGGNGAGPGAGAGNDGAGGGGGGLGGAGQNGTNGLGGNVAAGGNPYPGGVPADATMILGSGGGGSLTGAGGNGAGSIIFNATVFEFNGTISANGVDGFDVGPGVGVLGFTLNGDDPGGAGGAGSGGGVLVHAKEVYSSGDITANGGAGGTGSDPGGPGNDGGGGSGGLIKVFKEVFDNSGTWTLNAGGNSAGSASAGTEIIADSVHYPSFQLLEIIPNPLNYSFTVEHPDSLCLGVTYQHDALFDFATSRFDSIQFRVQDIPVLSDPNNTSFLYNGITDNDSAFFVGYKYQCPVASNVIHFNVFDLPDATYQVADIQNEVDYAFEITSETGNIASYSWTFGDGGNSNVRDPFHTFSGRGVFNTCLSVSDADTKCSSQPICQLTDVVCTSPAVGFDTVKTEMDFRVILRDTTDRAQEWAWSIEGGPFTSGSMDTLYQYVRDTTGVSIELAVRNHCVWDTLKNAKFDLGCAALIPDFDFIQDMNDPYLYQIEDNSLYTVNDWHIVLGEDTLDGGYPSFPHRFEGPFEVDVEYGIVNACLDTMRTSFKFTPDCAVPSIDWDYTYDEENPFLLHFTNTSTDLNFSPGYFWFFDDQDNSQSTTSSLHSPSHLFEGGDGTYTVYLQIENLCGDTMLTKEVNVCDTISSNFGYFEGKDNTVDFANITYGTPVESTWFFGTGDSIISESPTYQFPEETGTYTVCLRSVNLCADTSIYCEEITVCDDLESNFEAFFEDRTIFLANISEGEYSRLVWDLGNGVMVEDDEFLTYTYPPYDFSYNVCLYIENVCGEMSESCQYFVVTTGLNELEMSFETEVQPNPIKDRMNISWNETSFVEVEIRALDGKLKALHIVRGSNNLELDTRDWNSGVYFVHVRSENGESVHKILK